MIVRRRPPLRPKLPAVCRVLIDHAKRKRQSFDECLRDLDRGEHVRLSNTMIRMGGGWYNWWWHSDDTYPSQRPNESTFAYRKRTDDAVNAYVPETLEKLAARDLWPLHWLDGAGPVRFMRRGTVRELSQPASFSEVVNYASLLPTLLAAFDACTEVLERARVRCRARIVTPYRALRSGGIFAPENAPPRNWSDETTSAALAAYALASQFGFRLTLAGSTGGGALTESGWSAGAALHLDVPVIWRDGEVGEEMRFARWLEESGMVDSPNVRLVAATREPPAPD